LHGATFCNVYNAVGYEFVLGTSWSGYKLVLGTSWLGYELAWYDLVRVRVDGKPHILYINVKNLSVITQCKGDIHSSKTANIILPGLINRI